MKRCFSHAVYMLTTGLVTCLALLPPVSANVAVNKNWHFTVFLDDEVIGYHRFDLTKNGPIEQLTTEAEFEVSFLKIPLFRYRHKNVEVWQGECLKTLTATTDENGEQFSVEGAADGKVFQVVTHSGEKALPACISTFAYWDKSFLERTRLLNSQTGEYLDVEVEYLGEKSIRVRDTNTPAHHYQLTTEEANIELWYSRDHQWLALQSITRSGRVLRYVIE